MSFLVRLVANAVGLWLATVILPGMAMPATTGVGGQIVGFLVVALVFTIVNLIVRPIVALISLPLYLLTLGLFFLVVNALMLMLTGWLSSFTSFALQVDGFWTAVLGGIIVAVVSTVVEAVLPSRTPQA